MSAFWLFYRWGGKTRLTARKKLSKTKTKIFVLTYHRDANTCHSPNYFQWNVLNSTTQKDHLLGKLRIYNLVWWKENFARRAKGLEYTIINATKSWPTARKIWPSTPLFRLNILKCNKIFWRLLTMTTWSFNNLGKTPSIRHCIDTDPQTH